MDTNRERGIGYLILRAFFAQFWALQFWFKLHDPDSGITALRNLGFWAHHTAGELSKTPLPGLLVGPYTAALPWVELALGVLFALGLWQRAALTGAALLLVSLDLGLMLQGKHEDVARNMLFLLPTLFALQWEPSGRGFSLDALLARRRGPPA